MDWIAADQPATSGGEALNPSQVRDRVLRHHQALQGLLDQLEAEALWVAASRSEREKLRALREEVCARLSDKIALEERILMPALREADSWGELRADRLSEHHRRHRAAIDWLSDYARQDPPTLAAHVRRLIVDLRRDLFEAEALFLDADFLRDDVVGIGVDGG